MTRLIIARHGNTFDKGDTILRVGARTDLPLSSSGILQADNLGKFLEQKNLIPDIVFVSELKRVKETANHALSIMQLKPKILETNIFNEVDYGQDDGKTEAEVILRIGQSAMDKWESDGILPNGWITNPKIIIQNWISFGEEIIKNYKDKTILVVTSNGIARFAPHLTGEFDNFKKDNKIKLATGACSLLVNKDNKWNIDFWGQKL